MPSILIPGSRAEIRLQLGGESMRPNLPVLALLGSLLPAAAGSSENPPPPAPAPASELLGSPQPLMRPRLRLVWVDPTSAAPFAYAAMSREVRSILGAAGVDVVWDKKPAGRLLSSGDLAVILLNGEPARVGLRPDVMGCVTKGEGSSALWVNLTSVARVLGLDPRARNAWSALERHQVATALGRVIAHEIVHALAPQLPHATQGLLSATLGRSHLVHQRLRLDGDSADGFLRGHPAARHHSSSRWPRARPVAVAMILFRSRARASRSAGCRGAGRSWGRCAASRE